MKKLTTVVVACLASFFLSQNTFADATGDTYSFSMTAFDSAGSGSFVIPVTDIVFGSGPHAVAPSLFGNAGDTVTVFEQINTIDSDTDEYLIDIVAFDAGGNLTNFFADGSVSGGGLPFQLVFFDLGVFNGGADKLNPEFTPNRGDFIIDDANFFFVGTAGGLFGPGGSPFNLFTDVDASGIGASAGVDFGGDVATFNVGGEEFAGFSLSITVTSIPEPSTLALLSAGMVGLLAFRRRS